MSDDQVFDPPNVLNFLQRKHGQCKGQLRHGPIEVDSDLEQVTCKTCGEKLNPMQALADLCRAENTWRDRILRLKDQYQKAVQILARKTRTKCQHCRQFTRINQS